MFLLIGAVKREEGNAATLKRYVECQLLPGSQLPAAACASYRRLLIRPKRRLTEPGDFLDLAKGALVEVSISEGLARPLRERCFRVAFRNFRRLEAFYGDIRRGAFQVSIVGVSYGTVAALRTNRVAAAEQQFER